MVELRPATPADLAHVAAWIRNKRDAELWAGWRVAFPIDLASLTTVIDFAEDNAFSSFSDDFYSKYSPTGDRANWGRVTWTRLNDDSSTIYVWICQPVQMLRILAMSRATIEIKELTLLLPAEKTSAAR